MLTRIPHSILRITATLVALLLVAPVWARPEITKSPNDTRVYRYLELENGLRATLVSDPDTDKAAAALDVHVGSARDPDGREGLAHFLEHMLFLGTDKYPEPGEYQQFIRSHGGSNNAYTTFDDTNYFFDVDSAYLRPALDRFAQFFIAPRFDPAYVDREKNAVHSEYKLKIKEDGWRGSAAYREALNPNHPYSRFTVGALETLEDRPGDPIRDSLVRFHEEHYSAQHMGLAVLGKESLDELESWVREKFSAVPRTAAKPLAINVPLYRPGQLPAILEVRPVKETQRLSLSFPVPSSRKHYRSKPLSYLGNLVGHEGAGSLLAALKARHWADSLGAGEGPEIGEDSTFEIYMHLTNEGMEHIPDIVDLTFQMLRLIREEGVQGRLFDEQQKLAALGFLFQESSQPMRLVTSLAALIHRYPAENLLNGGYLFESFEPALIVDYLDRLTPANMLLTITAYGVEVDREAAWFGTPYRLRRTPEAWLSRWKGGPIDPALAIPEPNPFIPEDLAQRSVEQAGDVPERIRIDPGFELWFRNDDTFRLPRADFYLALRSPIAFDSPKHLVLTKLYLKQVREQLRESSYPAYLAGLGYSINPTLFGINVQIGGYNDKLSTLLSKVARAMASPVIEDARFADFKSDVRRELENALRWKPYERGMAEVRTLLLDPYWTKEEQLVALKDLEATDLRAFVPALLERFELEALAHGNVTREESIALATTIRESLTGETPVEPVVPTRVRRLSEGQGSLRELDVDHGDSALVIYYQGAAGAIRERARFGLLGQILSTPFYQELRTERQLGYVVFATASAMLEVPGLMLTIQSPGSSPTDLERNVDDFLRGFEASLDEMPANEFERQRNALRTILSKRPQTLTEQSDRYWSEINLHHEDFDSLERLLAALDEMTLESFKTTFETEIMGPNHRRLVVAAWGEKARTGERTEDWGKRLTLIEPAMFKRDLGFHDRVHDMH